MNAQILQFPYAKIRPDVDKHEATILKMPPRKQETTDPFSLAIAVHANLLSLFFPS
jgi:hypothetical protein